MSAATSFPRCEAAMRFIVLLALLLGGASFAQPFVPQTMRIAGTVERVDGDNVTIRAIEGGGTNTVHLAKNAVVFGIARATLTDIKPGAFVGVGAMPEPDGSQRAIRVTVFSEQQRGLGEGFRTWG